MTTDVPVRRLRRSANELRPDPRIHGRGKVPDPKVVRFDLAGYGQAVEEQNISYQVSRYALDTDVRRRC